MNIKDIISIAKEAGNKILEIYDSPFTVDYKEDNSPLTEADLAANKVIIDGLVKLDSTIPIISEESKLALFEERESWNLFWLVDPLDGTKQFVNKTGEFTVNIALIKNGRPILGVVYVPVTEVMYFADESGSFVEKEGEIKQLPYVESTSKLRVVASRSYFNKETKDYIENLSEDYELINKGSSLKMCVVAEGSADLYPRLGPTMEWDTAAAHAVLKFAGKNIYDYESGKEIGYNKRDLRNNWFIVK
jgi:3'(2'), 5'-bisphosphate nucleotidase